MLATAFRERTLSIPPSQHRDTQHGMPPRLIAASVSLVLVELIVLRALTGDESGCSRCPRVVRVAVVAAGATSPWPWPPKGGAVW